MTSSTTKNLVFGADVRPAFLAALGLSVLAWVNITPHFLLPLVSLGIALIGIKAMNLPTSGKMSWYGRGLLVVAAIGGSLAAYLIFNLTPGELVGLTTRAVLAQVAFVVIFVFFTRLLPVEVSPPVS